MKTYEIKKDSDYNLNVLKQGYYKGFRNIGNNFKVFFRNFKKAYQRIKYGYCYSDLWSLDQHLTVLLADMIDDLADTTHGYPNDMETPEDWEKYLKNISTLLRNSLDGFTYHNSYEKEWDDEFEEKINNYNFLDKTSDEEDLCAKWAKDEARISNLRHKDMQKAFDMIKKHFWDLWD